jgi:hypothetical protein
MRGKSAKTIPLRRNTKLTATRRNHPTILLLLMPLPLPTRALQLTSPRQLQHTSLRPPTSRPPPTNPLLLMSLPPPTNPPLLTSQLQPTNPPPPTSLPPRTSLLQPTSLLQSTSPLPIKLLNHPTHRRPMNPLQFTTQAQLSLRTSHKQGIENNYLLIYFDIFSLLFILCLINFTSDKKKKKKKKFSNVPCCTLR